MVFFKVDSSSPGKDIDGTIYEISNAATVDMWTCKETLCDIYNTLDQDQMDLECTFETYNGWRKDLVKLLKKWDGLYVKHQKSTFSEMNNIHMTAMKPLTNLIESNLNLDKLEKML